MTLKIIYAQKLAKGNTKEKGVHEYFPMLSYPRQFFQQVPSSIWCINGGKKFVSSI